MTVTVRPSTTRRRASRWRTTASVATALLVATAAPVVADPGNGPIARANGGGSYLLTLGEAELPGMLAFGAVQRADGSAHGMFRIDLDLGDLLGGGVASFRGEVTCLTVDATEGRAWIGAVVTANESTNPLYRDLPITQVGTDVWFRVLDDGEGAAAADRTTFAGFEGGAGIITSQEYCDEQPWPAGDARTHPVTAGNVQVRGARP